MGSLSVKEILNKRDFRDFVAARRIIVGAVGSSSLISLSPLSADIELYLKGGCTLAGSATLAASTSWLRACT
jgi:hypothetical protein